MNRTTVLISVGITVLILGGAIGWGLYDDTKLRPFDADEWLKKSYATAQSEHADAKPIEITAEAITSDGKVHLEQRGYLIVRFRYTPAVGDQKQVPAEIPGSRIATSAPGGCTGGAVRTHIWTGAKKSHFRHEWSEDHQKCLPFLDGAPKCTFRQIWQKAKAKGAPDPAYADIDLAQESGGGGSEKRWRFEIVNRPEWGVPTTVFHAEFPDDC